MSEREDDLRLERELRGLLRDRDPGPAPYRLRQRVDRVPGRDAVAAHGRRWRSSGPALAIAGLAIAAALVVMLGSVARLGPIETGPGASPAGTATMPPRAPWDYPEMRPHWVGSGAEPDPRLGLEPGVALPTLALLIGVAVLLGIGLRTTVRRSAPTIRARGRKATLTPARQVVSWIALMALLGTNLLTTDPLTVEVNGYNSPYSLSPGTPANPGDNSKGVIGPHPGQGQMLDVMITNRGLLPVSVVRPERWTAGVLPLGLADLPLQPERFISQRVGLEAAIALPPPGPVMLWPGQSTFTRVLIRHQSCVTVGVPPTPSATPWPTVGPEGALQELPDGTGYVGRTDLPLSATVLGIPRLLDPEMNFTVSMALPETCPPTEALVPADVSSAPEDLAMDPAGNGGVYGPGEITEPEVPRLLVAAAVLAVLLALATLVVVLRRNLVVGVALAVVVAGAGWAGQSGSLAEGSGRMPGIGALPSELLAGPDVYDVGRGGLLTFGFSVRNPGLVPISLHGANRVAGQIELVGLGRPWGAPSAEPADNIILWPWLILEPGEEIRLLGVARAGSCARRLSDSPDGAVVLSAIPFTWEALGVRHESVVSLSRTISVPADAACLAREAPGGADQGVTAFPGAAGVGVDGTGPFPLVPILAIGSFIALAVIGRRVAGPRKLAAILAMIVLGAWAAVGALMPVGVGVDYTGHGLGVVDAPAGSGDTSMYVNAAPSEAFALALGLYPRGALPIRLEGIDASYAPDPAAFGQFQARSGHWTGAWLSDAPGGTFGDPARPFAPIDLAGGGRTIWLVGTAAGCSVGPSFDPAVPAPTEAVGFSLVDVRLMVSVLGWPRTISLVDTANLKLLQPTTACDGSPAP